MKNFDQIKRAGELYDNRIKEKLDSVQAAGQWGKKEWINEICDIISKKIVLQKKDKILELGCGSGVLGNWLKEHCDEYCGIDISKLMLELFKQDISESENVELIQSTTNNVPLKDHYFDIVISNGVSMYLDSDLLKATLVEMKRLVKPNGKIFLGENVVSSRIYWEYRWFQNLSPFLQNLVKPYIKMRIYLTKHNIIKGKWDNYYKEVSPNLMSKYFHNCKIRMSDSAAMTIKRYKEGKNWKGNRRVDFLINLE